MSHSASAPLRPDRTPDAVIRGHDDVRLACYADGDPSAPVAVFVHGFPDTAGVWDRLIHGLSADYYCVRYDVRGAGRSGRPARTRAYRLARLAGDLAAVLDWAAPAGRPVHLVGHDWGSIASWETATAPDLAARLATYTSISGPCLDHVGHWIRRAWQRDRRRLLRQARRSWYIALFQLPFLAAAGWRWGLAPRWPATLARMEGERLPVARTLVADGVAGIRLYRANVLPRLRRPRQRHAVVPVHVIVPRHDPFVGRGFTQGLDRWVADLTVAEMPAAHWAIVTHATSVAAHLRAYWARHI